MTFHLVKVEKNNRYLVQTVDDVNEVIKYLENNYSENIEHLEDISFDDFKNEIDSGNKYKSGLYIVEHPDSINVYRVSTKIYFGYLFNSAQREITLLDRYELVVDNNE